MHEWQQCESYSAALRPSVDGRYGPSVTFDTNGGKQVFAALCAEDCFAGQNGQWL
jgi:hypothetical protein